MANFERYEEEFNHINVTIRRNINLLPNLAGGTYYSIYLLCLCVVRLLLMGHREEEDGYKGVRKRT